MNYADEAINRAIREAELLRERTRKRSTLQVWGSERDIIRATALAWFNNHRKQLATIFLDGDFAGIDETYTRILQASHTNALRSGYISKLKTVTKMLVALRSANVIKLSEAPEVSPPYLAADRPPDFASLINDPQMRTILERRWKECTICIAAGAPLAATVMIGGLLEGLLLARVNHEANKTPIYTAAAAPKDKARKTLHLKEWTLHNYIDVAHEVGWITVAAKDVGVVLRDYRNYIHPHKELIEEIDLQAGDAALLWVIGQHIARQILASIH